MGWHSTWGKPEWNNEDVKYLLADLCNAVNERIVFVTDKIDFYTASGVSQTPTHSDFEGMLVTGGTNSWNNLCEQLLSALPHLFGGGNYNSSFSEAYNSVSEVVSLAGYSTSDLVEDEYRKANFYRALKGMLPYFRYRSTPSEHTFDGDGIPPFYSTDPSGWAVTGPLESVGAGWSSATVERTPPSLTGLYAAFILEVANIYDPDPRKELYFGCYRNIPTEYSFTLTPTYSELAAGTFVKAKAPIAITCSNGFSGPPSTAFEIATISGSLGGEAFSRTFEHGDPNAYYTTVFFNTLNPSFVTNLTSNPFTYVGPLDPDDFQDEFPMNPEQFEIQVASPAFSVDLLYDLNPIFTYT